MTIVADSPNVATGVDPKVLAWVTELAEIRERVLNDRITSLDDPRAQQIINSDHYPLDDGGAHLAQHFGDDERFLEELVWLHFTPKPDLPRAAFNPPAWATTVEAEYGMWPEIPVYFVNSIDMEGILDVRLTYVETVFAEPVDDHDGTVWLPGEVSVGEEPELVIHNGWTEIRLGPESFGALHQLSAAIDDLSRALDRSENAAELTRRTVAGEPELSGRGGGL